MISKNSRSPAWRINQSLHPKYRNNEELDRLAQALVKEIKAKGHARDFPDLSEQIKSDSDWRKIISDKTATGAINVLVSLGGTIRGFEYVFRKMYSLDRSLFLRWGNFLDNKTGETNRGIMRRHLLDWLAGTDPKNRPKKGFVFECTRTLKDLGNDDYFHVIGIWAGAPNQEKLFPKIAAVKKSEELSDSEYLPTKSDCERVVRNLSSSALDNEIGLDEFLVALEKDLTEKGKTLKSNWKIITEKNLKLWSK